MLAILSLKSEGDALVIVLTNMENGKQTQAALDRVGAEDLHAGIGQWLTGEAGNWAKFA